MSNIDRTDPPVALQGCHSFRVFTLNQWVEYVRFVLWRKIYPIRTFNGWWKVCQELWSDRQFFSFVQVALSVEGSMADQFLDRYPGVRERIVEDKSLFAFQTCGPGTNLGDFAQDLADEDVRIGIAHAFDHILALSLEMLFPGISYKVSTVTKFHDREHYEYDIYALTSWKPKCARERRYANELVNQAASCATFYINTLIDVDKGKFPLLDALRELRNLHNIGDQPT